MIDIPADRCHSFPPTSPCRWSSICPSLAVAVSKKFNDWLLPWEDKSSPVCLPNAVPMSLRETWSPQAICENHFQNHIHQQGRSQNLHPKYQRQRISIVWRIGSKGGLIPYDILYEQACQQRPYYLCRYVKQQLPFRYVPCNQESQSHSGIKMRHWYFSKQVNAYCDTHKGGKCNKGNTLYLFHFGINDHRASGQ